MTIDCACHDQYPVDEIGDWVHTLHGTKTVRETASDPQIWDQDRCEVSHDELRRRIGAAGGVDCGHALHATTLGTGAVHLGNGVHRWAVAVEVGIESLPVRMTRPEDEAPMWSPGTL